MNFAEVEEGKQYMYAGQVVTVVKKTGIMAGKGQSYAAGDRLDGATEEDRLIEVETKEAYKHKVKACDLSPL